MVGVMPRRPLPLAEGPAERADAARNRQKVLNAAQEVFASKPPDQVTMDDIARAAGVGRATLYRRYPSVAAVAEALLDEHERAIQQRMLAGEGNFSPTRPPSERLWALYEALLELLDTHAALVLGSEIGRARYETGAYGVWHTYVRSLLDEAGIEHSRTMADVLLAPLAADLFLHVQSRRHGRRQLAAALRRLAVSVLDGR